MQTGRVTDRICLRSFIPLPTSTLCRALMLAFPLRISPALALQWAGAPLFLIRSVGCALERFTGSSNIDEALVRDTSWRVCDRRCSGQRGQRGATSDAALSFCPAAGSSAVAESSRAANGALCRVAVCSSPTSAVCKQFHLLLRSSRAPPITRERNSLSRHVCLLRTNAWRRSLHTALRHFVPTRARIQRAQSGVSHTRRNSV